MITIDGSYGEGGGQILRTSLALSLGGRFTVNISPAKKLDRPDIVERGSVISRRARAAVSNPPSGIADRELKVVGRELNWDNDCLMVKEVDNSPGPGNILINGRLRYGMDKK